MRTASRSSSLTGLMSSVGSCCGSVSAHVRAMAKALGKLPRAEREWRSTTGKAMSAYEYYGHAEVET